MVRPFSACLSAVVKIAADRPFKPLLSGPVGNAGDAVPLAPAKGGTRAPLA